MTDWNAYRKCPVCAAGIGQACTVLSGKIVGGQTDKISVKSELPHTLRKMRVGR